MVIIMETVLKCLVTPEIKQVTRFKNGKNGTFFHPFCTETKNGPTSGSLGRDEIPQHFVQKIIKG